MADEEDEPTVYYVAAQDGMLASAAGKQKNALNHFNYFLKKYCVQIGIKPVTADAIPYHGIPPKEENKAIFEFWDNCIGAFFTYMGDARHGCNPKANRVSKRTAEGYCSSVKGFFTNKFRTENPIPVFQQDQWKKLREKLKGKYRENNRGKSKKEGHTPSTRHDREAMSTACVWKGSPAFAEFWHLLNTSYHCAGRGSEVALIRAEGIKVSEVNELNYRYEILTVDIQRQKNGPFQTLPIYPHRDGIYEDFYFSLIHLIVLNGCNHEFIFPHFSKAALKTTEGKSDSGVSREWTKLFTELRDSFEVLADEINEEQSSHSNRSGSNQDMAESRAVSGLAQIFRTGWTVNSIHSVFDYVFGSITLSQQAGKAVAKWTTPIGDTILGGQAPTFDDIKTDPDRLRKFTDVLFEDDVHSRWVPKVRELLVMSLLLRFDQYIEILESHPFTTLVEVDDPRTYRGLLSGGDNLFYSTVQDSLFINRVQQALSKADQHATAAFAFWITEAKQAFLQRNLPAMPIQNFDLYHDDPSLWYITCPF